MYFKIWSASCTLFSLFYIEIIITVSFSFFVCQSVILLQREKTLLN